MPFRSWFLFIFQDFVLKHLMRPSAWWSPFFRAFFNSLTRLSIILLEKFPILAYFTFGKEYANVNIFPAHFD
jgi:hypothetical protein